jgi:hypothetical protein
MENKKIVIKNETRHFKKHKGKKQKGTKHQNNQYFSVPLTIEEKGKKERKEERRKEE